MPSSQLGRELRRSAGHPFPPPIVRMCKAVTRRGLGLGNGEREPRFSLPALAARANGSCPCRLSDGGASQWERGLATAPRSTPRAVPPAGAAHAQSRLGGARAGGG